MEEWIKMKDELENLNKNSTKGRKTLESANTLQDIDSTNTREYLFNVVKDLYNFSKKVVNSSKPGANEQDATNIEETIKKQLADVLPGLLKTALSEVPALQKKEETTNIKEAAPTVRHTVTFTESVGKEETPITPRNWSEVVRPDLKNSLRDVPVKNVTFTNGTATLDFTSKAHMETAQKNLSAKYKVVTRSADQKKLDPKLTIYDVDITITDESKAEEKDRVKKELLEELLEKNEEIRTLHATKPIKVVFFSKELRQVVIQVSPEMRECIRQNGDQVHLALGCHRVKDRIHVIQCYHCQEFGHMANTQYCKKKDNNPVCFYCAGDHSSKECKSKRDRKPSKIKCHNCAKSRNSADKANACTHKASDTLCPFYIRERARIMSRTAGCTEQAKNWYLQKAKEQQLKYRRI